VNVNPEKKNQEEKMKMITGEKVIKNVKDGGAQMVNGNKNAGKLTMITRETAKKFSVPLSIT